MKKTILIVLILAAVIGSPYWVGKQVEEQLPAFLQRAAQVGQINIELTSYERGLFRSHAVTTLHFHGVTNEQLILQHSIWHGPLPIGQSVQGGWQIAPAAAVIETTLPDGDSQQGVFGDLLNRLPGFGAFHELTVISMTGSATSRFSIPPFSQDFLDDGNSTHFDWAGLTGISEIGPEFKRIESQATLTGIKISDPTSETEIKGVSTNIQVHEDSSGLLLGNVTLDSNAFSFGPRGLPPELSVQGLQLRNKAQLDGVTVNYAIEIAADKISHPAITFAPAGFEVLFSRLDAATILAVQHQLQNLQSNIVNLSENDVLKQVSDIYIAALPVLLQKKPEISLNYLRAQSSAGELWAKGNLTLSNENNVPISLDRLSQLVQAEGEAHISEELLLALVRQSLKQGMSEAWQSGQFGDISEEELTNMIETASKQQIEALVLQGLLIQDQENFKIDFSFSDQQAILNGQPLQN